MKIKLLLLSALIFSSACFAKIELPSQLEIEQEIDALIDSTDAVTEKNLKASLKKIKKGIKHHDKRRFKKAIKSYEQALEKNPLSSMAHYELGLTLTSIKNIVSAYEHTLKALALEPGLEAAHVLKASLLDDAGYVEESINAWVTLIDINPKSYMGWLNKGITHLKIEQFEPAEEAFKKAVELEPNHPSGHYFMFAINNMRGYTYAEEEHLKNYLAVSKGDHRRDDAIKRLEEIKSTTSSINIDPDSGSMQIQLIKQLTQILWKQGEHRKAYPDEYFYRPSLEEEEAKANSLLEILLELEGKEESDVDADELAKAKSIINAGFVKEKAYLELKEYLGKRDLQWGEDNKARIQEYEQWAKSQ